MDDTASLEEFPLQMQRRLSTAHAMTSASTDDLGLKPAKNHRHKHFSLQALARPLKRAAKGSSASAVKSSHVRQHHIKTFTTSTDSLAFTHKLRSAMSQPRRSVDATHEDRKVSFSPSTDDEVVSRPGTPENMTEGFQRKRTTSLLGWAGVKIPKPQRRASLDFNTEAAHLERSLSISSMGIQWRKPGIANSTSKSDASKPKLTRQKAVAARHARVLERIINAGSSFELEEIKAKRAKKLGGVHKVEQRTNVQAYPVVSSRKVKALKQALMDHDLANGIIDELRYMHVDFADSKHLSQASEAEEILCHVLQTDSEQSQDLETEREQTAQRFQPLRAVCLDCTEEEADARREAARKQNEKSTEEVEEVAEKADPSASQPAAPLSASVVASAMAKLGNWLLPAVTVAESKPMPDGSQAINYVVELQDDLRKGDVQETISDSIRLGTIGLSVVQPAAGAVAELVEDRVLPANKTLDTKVTSFAPAVIPISMIANPTGAIAAFGAQRSGAFDALATVSAAAVSQATGGQAAMLEVYPPTDRMAIFIHWWGFEITLPAPSVRYLSTAQSVSSAFMGFLQTMVTTGGVPELLPFVRYISSFMDMEFSAIKSQNRNGKGVVVAATWLMPFALVPRPWDYGYGNDGGGQASSPARHVEKKPFTPSSPPSTKSARPAQSLAVLSAEAGALPMFPVIMRSKSDGNAAQSDAATNKPRLIRSSSDEYVPHSPANSRLNISVLDSVQELPEGSVRIK